MVLRTCSALCTLLSVAAAASFAQSSTATLVGTVLDSSGSVVTGASIQIKKSDTDDTRIVHTDPKGEFTMPDLAPGVYDVTIGKAGFHAIRETGIELQLDQVARLEFHLEVGAMTQAVEVTGVSATVPTINTENGTKGEVMVSKVIIEMPLNGRDFSNLALLVPGGVPRSGRWAGLGIQCQRRSRRQH